MLLKKLFLLLLFAICAIVWLKEPIKKKLGVEKTASATPTYSLPRSNFILPDPVPLENNQPPCLSLAEYVEQAKTNPGAYNQLLNCGQQEAKRTDFDKLMNFLSRLKYE